MIVAAVLTWYTEPGRPHTRRYREANLAMLHEAQRLEAAGYPVIMASEFDTGWHRPFYASPYFTLWGFPPLSEDSPATMPGEAEALAE